PNQPGTGCCARMKYHIISGDSYTNAAWGSADLYWDHEIVGANVFFYNVTSGENFDVGKTYNSSVGWDGISNITHIGGIETGETSYLNTYFVENHFPGACVSSNPCYSDSSRLSVAAHELGHVMGLAHVSACTLMNPATFGSSGRYTANCGYISTPQSD